MEPAEGPRPGEAARQSWRGIAGPSDMGGDDSRRIFGAGPVQVCVAAARIAVSSSVVRTIGLAFMLLAWVEAATTAA